MFHCIVDVTMRDGDGAVVVEEEAPAKDRGRTEAPLKTCTVTPNIDGLHIPKKTSWFFIGALRALFKMFHISDVLCMSDSLTSMLIQ